MAAILRHYFKFAFFAVLVKFCVFFNTNLANALKSESSWSNASATWYGSAMGAGSDGGACGYGDAVEQAPFNKMVASGSPSLFNSGRGCGTCYQVSCTEHGACSGEAVVIAISDECAGPPCDASSVHFTMSGSAYGAMAKNGRADELRGVGNLQIQYRRVACKWSVPVAFRVDPGSNPYYFAATIEFVDGDAEIGGVELQEAARADTWLPMKQSWGAVWRFDSSTKLEGPFSIRLTTVASGSKVVADDVIPADWKAGQTYNSSVNFEA